MIIMMTVLLIRSGFEPNCITVYLPAWYPGDSFSRLNTSLRSVCLLRLFLNEIASWVDDDAMVVLRLRHGPRNVVRATR